jgi:hypothetical protein
VVRRIRRVVLLLALTALTALAVAAFAGRSASTPIGPPPATVAVPPADQYVPVPAGPPGPGDQG